MSIILEEYKYVPLYPTKDPLRLISILPPRGDTIRCQLTTFNESNCPPYQALSYTWGESGSLHRIELNGRSFKVGTNLRDFLALAGKQFWLGATNEVAKIPYIWIDQICIDQNSIEEKNQQVRKMARIYKDAERAVVWLGVTDETSKDNDMQMILEADSIAPKPIHIAQSTLRFHLTKFAPSKFANSPMQPMFRRAYWSRIWTVQEFLLASDILLICGHRCVRWDQVFAFYRIYRQLSFDENMKSADSYPTEQDFFGPAYTYLNKRYDRETTVHGQSPDRFSLFTSLSYFSHQGCQDPRDKIYGLLGLVEGGAKIDVDYAKSVDEVFCDVMVALNVKAGEGGPFWDMLHTVGLNMGVSDALLSEYQGAPQ